MLGYRLHGNLLSLANRIPSVYFTYDSRTVEFAETFQIPSFNVFAGSPFRLEDYWDQALFENFNRAYYQRYRDMRLFLDENGVAHKMVDEGCRAPTPASRLTSRDRTRLAPLAPAPDVTGYVEAVTADRCSAGPGRRDAEPADDRAAPRRSRSVAQPWPTSCARTSRATASATGRHAFNLPVPESVRPALAELRVFARAGESKAVPLGAPPAPRTASPSRSPTLQRGVETLVDSQRLIHRNLQAALLQQAGTGRRSPRLPRRRAALQDRHRDRRAASWSGSKQALAAPLRADAASRHRRRVALGLRRRHRGRSPCWRSLLGARRADHGWAERRCRRQRRHACRRRSRARRRSAACSASPALSSRLQHRRARRAALQYGGVQPRHADPRTCAPWRRSASAWRICLVVWTVLDVLRSVALERSAARLVARPVAAAAASVAPAAARRSRCRRSAGATWRRCAVHRQPAPDGAVRSRLVARAAARAVRDGLGLRGARRRSASPSWRG